MWCINSTGYAPELFAPSLVRGCLWVLFLPTGYFLFASPAHVSEPIVCAGEEHLAVRDRQIGQATSIWPVSFSHVAARRDHPVSTGGDTAGGVLPRLSCGRSSLYSVIH